MALPENVQKALPCVRWSLRVTMLSRRPIAARWFRAALQTAQTGWM
jgi:hypothetical protein